MLNMTKKFDIESLDGIGETRGQRLRDSGVTTPYDIIIRGAHEISVLTEMDEEICDRLVETVKQQLREQGTIPKTDQASRKEYRDKILRLDTGSERLNEMLSKDDITGKKQKGGIETQALTAIYGENGGGKTQTSLTLCAMTLMAGHGVMFVDCENTFDDDRLAEIISVRGGDTSVMDNLMVEQAFDSNTILRIINTMTQTILEKNIKLLIIDGATGIFRFEYDQGRGDLNPRQNKLKPFFLHLKNMAYYLNIAIVITNQVMGNPDPYAGSTTKQIGGHIAGHSPKYTLWIKKNPKNKRTVVFEKSNRHAKDEIVIYINESGISDDETLKKKKGKISTPEKDMVDTSRLLE